MKKIITKLNKKNWDGLKELDGATMNDKLDLLINIVQKEMHRVKYTNEMKGIQITEEVSEKLDALKLTHGESRDNIVARALICFNEMNNNISDEDWIPFKLSSTINKNLVLECQVEYFNREVLIKHSSNEWQTELPTEYILNDIDMSLEFNSWVERLNWIDIIDFVINHSEDIRKVNRYDYVLEVNYI